MKVVAKRVGGLAQEVMYIYAFWGQPFNEEIDRIPISANIRELVVDSFDDTQDPHAHLQAFQTQMYISGGNDALSCKLFLGTLRGVAMKKLASQRWKNKGCVAWRQRRRGWTHYFTKWVEANPITTISAERVKHFYWKRLICQFGLPVVIVSYKDTIFFPVSGRVLLATKISAAIHLG
ncbi:hypothetical protein CR513_11786, partial [Mucuna pruriens]